MNIFIKYICLIILIQNIITEDEHPGIIKLKFKLGSTKDFLSVPIQIGSSKKELDFILDIGSERTWILNSYYDKQSSQTFENLDKEQVKTQDYFRYEGTLSTENFHFDNKTLEGFQFLYVKKVDNNEGFKAVLSLGKEYDSKKYSLVYKSSNNAITFYNAFYIKFENENEGNIQIGDAPEDIKRSNLINKCKVIEGQNPLIKWKCELTHIFIGGVEDNQSFKDDYLDQYGYYIREKSQHIKEVFKPVIFESIYNSIYCPKRFLSYFKENYFYNSITNSYMCKLIDNGQSAYFTCTKSEVNSLKRLNFVLSEITDLSFPARLLFECNDKTDTCIFLVRYSSRFDYWVFGLPILKNYGIIFDYNMKDIEFYSQSNKYLVNMPDKFVFNFLNFLLYFLIFIIILLLIGLGLIYFMRNKNKKRQQIEEEIYENF